MSMTINKKIFFSELSKHLFKKALTASQVQGIEADIEAFDKVGSGFVEHFSYGVATDYHETGGTMQGVREGFAKSDKAARAAVARLFAKGKIKKNYALPGSYGNSFYGRGKVQLTWEDNYKRMGKIIGVDLVRHPDLALDTKIAALILFEGIMRAVSTKGDFSNVALEDFINARGVDYVKARRTVNGSDKAGLIAGYAKTIEEAARRAGFTNSVLNGTRKPAPKPEVVTEAVSEVRNEAAPVEARPDNGDTLRAIQTRLVDLGYHEVGEPDGKWGNRTRTAVLAFRAENGLPAKSEIDVDFMAKLWSAQPRKVSEERATATTKEVAQKVEVVQSTSFLTKLMQWLGLGSIGAGGASKFFDSPDSGGFDPDLTAGKLSSVQYLWSVVQPMWPWIAIAIVAGVAFYYARKATQKGVEGYKSGSIFR